VEEHADPADDFRRPRYVFHDPHRSRARLFEIGMFTCKPTNAGSGVGRGRGDRLIHFVSQGSSQLSHGRYPIHSRELCVRLTQSFAFLLGPLALGDVDSGAHQFDELA